MKRRRNFLLLAGFAGAIAGAIGGVAAYHDMKERQALEQQLQEWERKEWIENLLEMRRQELLKQTTEKPC